MTSNERVRVPNPLFKDGGPLPLQGPQSGMTMRDYFAGQALGMFSFHPSEFPSPDCPTVSRPLRR